MSAGRRIMALCLAVVMVVSSMMPFAIRAKAEEEAGKDVTGLLNQVTISVTQNNKELKEGEVIDPSMPFSVKGSFDVPVYGDGVDSYVNRNDYAQIFISDSQLLQLADGVTREPKDLKDQMGNLIGTIAYASNDSVEAASGSATGVSGSGITANISFSGDESIYNGERNSVKAAFSCDFKISASQGNEGDPSAKEIVLFGKTFQLGGGNQPEKAEMSIAKRATSFDKESNQQEWTITISSPKEKFWTADLLVYGQEKCQIWDCEIDTAKVPEGVDLNQAKTYCYPGYNQRYVEQSFVGSDNMTCTVVPVTREGVEIGQMVFVTGETTAQGQYSYKTTIDSKALFQGVYNLAVLGNGSLVGGRSGDGSKPYSVIGKCGLKAEAAGSDYDFTLGRTNVAEKLSNSWNNYNYEENTAVYTLFVNASGQTLNQKVMVTDILPKGWEWKEITKGEKALVFKAKAWGDRNTYYEDSEQPLNLEENQILISQGEEEESQTLTVTFEKGMPDQERYEILVKAGPTEDTIQKMCQGAALDWSYTNNARFETEGYYPAESATKTNISSLGKQGNYNKSTDSVDWTITYHPIQKLTEEEITEVSLVDELGKGMELLKTGKGKVDLSAIQVYEIKAEGNRQLSEAEVAGRLSYLETERKLIFKLPNENTSYQINYSTTIDEEGYVGLENTVSVIGGVNKDKTKVCRVEVSSATREEYATSKSNLMITKVDENQQVLAGAVFGLFDEQGNCLGQKTSNQKGRVFFSVKEEGNYILKEIEAPKGYEKITKEYQIEYKNDEYQIDGVPGNKLTVENHKIPETPATPTDPGVPTTPTDPGVPTTPTDPGVPTTPTVPALPATPVQVTLAAEKMMDGAPAQGSNYRFILSQNGQALEVVTNQNEKITFAPLSFDKEGVYVYNMSEEAGSDIGVVYDTQIYTITIRVFYQDTTNSYRAETSILRDGQEYIGTPVFQNKTKTETVTDEDVPSTGPDPEEEKTPKEETVTIPEGNTPRDKVQNEAPETGDDSSNWLWAGLSLMSAAALVMVLRKEKIQK